MPENSLSLKVNLDCNIDNNFIPNSIDNLIDLRYIAIEVEKWYNSINKKLLMETIGEIVDYIVQENFEQQGRPEKWDNWSGSVSEKKGWAYRRTRPPYNKSNGQILQLFGNLRNSLHITNTGNDFVEYGTNVEYAAAMDMGFIKKNIPARPFMVIPESEYYLFAEAIIDFFN